jgi:phosphoserine phosphatase
VAIRAIILRHGQSSFNSQNRIQGRSDLSVLTGRGLADAAVTGKAIAGISLAAIYCSPLQRAKQTAQTVISCFKDPQALEPDLDLLEVDLPPWEGLLQADVKEKYPTEYQTWKQNPEKLQLNRANGEEFYPVLSLYEQAAKFWQKTLPKHDGKTILIVAHNGINRALISTALGIPAAQYHSIQQSNCGITVLNFADSTGDRVQLESLNQLAHLGDPLPTLRPRNAGPRFLLVRHGETDWNKAGKFQGKIDIPLNDNGRNQASLAAEFLKDIPIEFGYTSPLSRPKETAQIILREHPPIELAEYTDLQEIGHGLWEGKFESEIEREFPGELERWRNTPADVQMPEGENLQVLWDRAIATWQQILDRTGNDTRSGLVVAHDATNKVLLCYLMGLGLADFWKIKQGNGAVTVIDYPEGITGKPVIQALNLTSHLSGTILDRTAAGAL